MLNREENITLKVNELGPKGENVARFSSLKELYFLNVLVRSKSLVPEP